MVIGGAGPASRLVISSGRQMPTSEHRGHLGLATSGGGATGSARTRRALDDGGADLVDLGVGEVHAHALLRGRVVELGVIAAVAAVPQRQRLRGDLDAIGGPGAAGDAGGVGGGAPLVVDGDDGAVLGLDEVGLGEDALRRGGDRHRAGAEQRVGEVLAGRQRRGLGVHPLVDPLALEGVGAVVPLTRDVLEVEETGAVDELVEHPGGDEVGVSGVVLLRSLRGHDAPPT